MPTFMYSPDGTQVTVDKGQIAILEDGGWSRNKPKKAKKVEVEKTTEKSAPKTKPTITKPKIQKKGK